MIHLLAELVAGQTHFFGIEDDDKITSINARRKNGLVLTTQDTSLSGDLLFLLLEYSLLSSLDQFCKLTGLTETRNLVKSPDDVKFFFDFPNT
jgi:hypothetical protein